MEILIFVFGLVIGWIICGEMNFVDPPKPSPTVERLVCKIVDQHKVIKEQERQIKVLSDVWKTLFDWLDAKDFKDPA